MKKCLLFLLSVFVYCQLNAQTSYTWNGSVSTAWNTAANWTPNGIPAAVDNITIVTGSNNCILSAAAAVTNITVTSGTLNLGTFTLTAVGNAVFTAGTVSNGTLTVNAGTGSTATLTNPVFNTAALNITTGAITINGGTYGRPVAMNQTGTVQTTGTGNATFNDALSITNSGTNNFRINGNCTFNGAVTFTNTGSGYLLPELNTGNVYNSTLALNNTSASANIRMCYLGTTNFNGNITISNTSTGNITFGEQASAIAHLNPGFTISTGGAGFTDGRLVMNRFRQLGTTAQTLLFTGTSGIQLLAGCIFNGSLTVTAPTFNLAQATYKGAVTFNKTGATNDATSGGNTFNGTLTVNHTGSGYWSFANGTADIYNGDVYANNTGTERIIFGHNSPGNQFNGNVYVSQSSTGVGIALGWNSSITTTVTMAAGKNIFIGSGGFTAGYLQMCHLQQADATPINLSTTGTSSIISYLCTFTGTVDLTAPDIYPYGGAYNAAVTFTKTGGGSNNHNNGNQNIFNSTVTVNQQSSTGYFLLGYNSNDLFNDNIIVNSTASGGISFGWSGGTGTPTLAAGKTIMVGATGFNAGYIQLGTFTELGTTPITLSLTGTASFYIVNSAGPCVFGGAIDITAPDIYIRGGIFNDAAAFTRTGSNGDHNNGFQNIFNSTCTINNQGTGGYFMLGYNSNDLFNGNIIVSSVANGGISIGWSGGTGTPTLAAGKTILIGGAGFSAGYFQLGTFTELGTAPITLNMTGTSDFYVVNSAGPCVFGGPLDVTAPELYIRGGTFNNTTAFTKTGGGSDHNNGFQNIFNSTLAINQQGTGYFMLGYNSNDLFNDDITVTSVAAGGVCLGNTSGTGTPTLAAGKTILIGGAGFSAGYLRFGGFIGLGTTPINITTTGTSWVDIHYASSPSVFNEPFSVTAPDIYVQGGTFNNTAAFTKTGGGSNHNNGNLNIFNSTCTINQQSSTGYFMLGYNSNDQFNDDITVTSTGTGGIYFGWSGGGTGFPVLASGKTILVGAAGFSQGFLQFNQFTQLGAAPVNLTFTGTSTYLLFARNSTFGGSFTCVSPSILFNGATFNNGMNATKTGPNGDGSAGGNTFNGNSFFTNTGAGYMLFGNSTPDTWNSDVTFTNTGTERILPAWNSAGNIFNGNITVSSTGSAQGINFCGNAVANATLAATKTVITGTYNGGYLILQRFTQLGSAPVNLLLTVGASYIQYGPSSTFGGNVVSSSPRLYFSGCTFQGTTTCTKTGAVDDDSNGSNVYTGVSIMTNSGSGRLLFGNINSDIFASDVTFNNTGAAYIYAAHNSAGNVFNGNVTLNNTPTITAGFISMDQYGYTTNYNGNIIVTSTSGAGILFGNNTGAAVLASGKTITIGAAGFSSGTLLLKAFTQVGSMTQSLTLTGTTTMLQYGPASSFDGNVTSVSPNVLFNGCTFNGTGNFTKNNSGNNQSTGGNIFNGVSVFTNTGAGYLMLGNVSADTWNADVTFSNSGAERILPCWTAAGNQFNGNIVLNSTGSSVGINFCGNTTATATLAAGKNVSTGTCNSGYLILQRFTQNGTAANNLTITSPGSYIQFGPSSQFGGNVTTSSPGIFFHGCVFNGAVNSVKTGTSNDGSNGGNIFNGATVLTDNGTGYLLMANVSADAYNGDVTFVQNTTGTVYPNYNTSCTYSANVTVTSPSGTAITFGSNAAGVAIFTGTSAQTINKTAGSAIPVFTRLLMNKASADVTLNTRINISSVLTLTSGIINTTSANILNMNNASTTTVGNAASYINGPMNYDMAASGARTLYFPVGKVNDWRPAVLALNHSASTAYTYNAEVFDASASALNWAMPVTVDTVSFIHYWDINRYTTGTTTSVPSTGLSGNQAVTLYFGANDGVRDGAYLTICKNTSIAPASWIDIGGTGAPAYAAGAYLSGNVKSTSTPSAFTSFSRFTLGSKILGWNPLPIELVDFNAIPVNDKVALKWITASETNNNYFTIEKTKDGSTFEFVVSVNAYGSGTSSTTQTYNAVDAHPYEGVSYYRLKQTDKDGKSVYSSLRAIDFTATSFMSVYPNPSAGQFTLNVSADYLNTVVKVFSAEGQEVLMKVIGDMNNSFDLSGLSNGLYYITADNGVELKRENIMISK